MPEIFEIPTRNRASTALIRAEANGGNSGEEIIIIIVACPRHVQTDLISVYFHYGSKWNRKIAI